MFYIRENIISVYLLALLWSLLPFDLTFIFFAPLCGLASAWPSPTGLSLRESCLDDVLLLTVVELLELVPALDEPELARLRRC